MVQNDKTFCLSRFISGTMHHQRIIQEFHLGISHEHHLVMRTLHLGCFGEGAMVSPLLLFSYITSRFAYMKHLFCWQFILIFLYLLQIMSADKLSFGLNVLLLYSSYCFPYFLLYENCLFLLSLKTQQWCMPTQPCSQCFFPNTEQLIGEESWSFYANHNNFLPKI